MLNRYQIGQSVSDEDRADLTQLLKSHSQRAIQAIPQIRGMHVTRGRFGKHCFAYETPEQKNSKFSYVRCVTNASRTVRENALGEPIGQALREQKNKEPATQTPKAAAAPTKRATASAKEKTS